MPLRGIVHVDADVLKWFAEHAGRDYSAEINRVLRRYIAEGKPQTLAAAIKSAINWTGKNRIPPPQKLVP